MLTKRQQATFLLLILQTSCWDKLNYQTASSRGYRGTQINSPSAKLLKWAHGLRLCQGSSSHDHYVCDSHAHTQTSVRTGSVHTCRYAHMHDWTHNPILCDWVKSRKRARRKKRERKETEGEEERERGDTKRGGGFTVAPGGHVVLWYGVRVLLDRREVLVSSLPSRESSSLLDTRWASGAWIHPSSSPSSPSLSLLPPQPPTLPPPSPPLSSPSSCSSFPGPMGAVPRCWVNLLKWVREGKREKSAKHLHVGQCISSTFAFFLLFSYRKNLLLHLSFHMYIFFQARGRVEYSHIIAKEV